MNERLLFGLDEEFIAASYSKERTQANSLGPVIVFTVQQGKDLSFGDR
jgi:hypothetical protein